MDGLSSSMAAFRAFQGSAAMYLFMIFFAVPSALTESGCPLSFTPWKGTIPSLGKTRKNRKGLGLFSDEKAKYFVFCLNLSIIETDIRFEPDFSVPYS
jgi:hypothetical protein